MLRASAEAAEVSSQTPRLLWVFRIPTPPEAEAFRLVMEALTGWQHALRPFQI